MLQTPPLTFHGPIAKALLDKEHSAVQSDSCQSTLRSRVKVPIAKEITVAIQHPNHDPELTERLAIIESMMQAGRCTTERWGWAFVIWGVAYFVATGWASFLPQAGGRTLAWPVTMIFAALLTAVIARRRTRLQPRTDKARFIQATWAAVGYGIFIYAFSQAWSGHVQPQTLMAGIATLLGVANLASGLMLRWKVQMGVGLLCWVTAAASAFVGANTVAYLFLAATLVCMIGFGLYLMIRESRARTAAHPAAVQHA